MFFNIGMGIKVSYICHQDACYIINPLQVPTSQLHMAPDKFRPNPADLPSALSNSLVFTVVRHPFERLVSGGHIPSFFLFHVSIM